MSLNVNKLKTIQFTIDGVSYECQVQSFTLDPGIEDGEVLWSYCADGRTILDADPNPTLAVTFYSDWRSAGINEYLWTNQGEDAAFQLDIHPDDPTQHVRWTGTLRIKPGPVGGEVRANETTEVTFQLTTIPVYARV
ncbi:hypothetical protein ACIA2T_19690 [Amycolatopsis japonica]|uniref:hypothetical protein n=1 Tax=Amycolatopsis japonica TaxID=208439 RepID=UPI0037B872FF